MRKNLLWKAFAAFVILLSLTTKTKAQELKFDYDLAGNQIKREFICVNCSTFALALVTKLPEEEVENPTKNPAKAARKITGYPNPLTEVLNLKWDVSSKYYITKIEVVSQTGLTVFKQEYGISASYLDQTSIPFQRQVPGTYMVKVSYSDGKQVVIKVVKL